MRNTLSEPLLVTTAPSSSATWMTCGEPSGEFYAKELVAELRRRHPGLEAIGLGGDLLAAEDVRLLAHLKDLAVVGLFEGTIAKFTALAVLLPVVADLSLLTAPPTPPSPPLVPRRRQRVLVAGLDSARPPQGRGWPLASRRRP